MGYRSNGWMALPKEVFEELTDEHLNSLSKWTFIEEEEDIKVYRFEDWKWYPSFSEVQLWENLFNDLESSDIISYRYGLTVLGEDFQLGSNYGEFFNVEVSITW